MTETRAEKAQRLVDEGRVGFLYRGFHYTSAETKGENGLYVTILYDDDDFFCSCDWGRYHSHTDDLCAHALAVKLAVLKESP